MSKYTIHPEKEQFYFCTITCYQWLHLIEITNLHDKIYEWFDLLYKQECLISAYVLMPNHFHFLAYQLEKSPLLNNLVSNGKRFLSYDIVGRLQELNNMTFLQKMNRSVNVSEKIKGKVHNTFRPSFDAKICQTENDIIRTIDYIHYNPVSKGWNLVDNYLQYPHSSACFYEYGLSPGFSSIVHYQDILYGRF